MTLEKLLPELKFDHKIEKAIIDRIRNDRSEIEELSKIAYHKTESGFELCRQDPFTRLVVIMYLLVKTYDAYKMYHIPDEVIFDTFRDVSLRCNYFYQRTNEMAVSEEEVGWYRNIMKVDIFKLGSMQFQKTGMLFMHGEQIEEQTLEFLEKYKTMVPEGTPVLSCHIQEGEDLSEEAVENSFKLAEEFFKKYFPQIEFKAYVCYTWLLYPDMVAHLKENSKIRSFAKRFHVISSCADPGLAMKMLFPEKEGKAKAPLTSLQKMAIEHKEWFGFSCGVILR